MNEIKCPKCGEVFQVDESGYASIVKQVRDKAFKDEIKSKEESFLKEKDNAVNLAKSEAKRKFEKEIAELNNEILKLKGEQDRKEAEQELAINKAVNDKDRKIADLEIKLQSKENELITQKNTLTEHYEKEISDKDELIEHYKNLKAKLSTKMLGETLEQHCEAEFNKLRATAFKNAYFEKDNDAKGGTKGDYIYRECDENGVEIISIMFEMKNEMDTTATKHKNEDFFKKLDKDRNDKNCEYAVLVSMLEADSELYNTGIVDVSYKYKKMYVIRPQFFIPMITILRNAALNSLSYKQDLAIARRQSIDITNFENNMHDFQKGFLKTYDNANNRLQDAIDEINDTIKKLEAVKESFRLAKKHLGVANEKAQCLSIKGLTKDSPMLAAEFAKLNKDNK